jgi:hypothetical protein
MNNIRQYASPNMPAMLLVGNKVDLPNRVVPTEEGLATAKQYNVRFIGASGRCMRHAPPFRSFLFFYGQCRNECQDVGEYQWRTGNHCAGRLLHERQLYVPLPPSSHSAAM